MSAAINPNSDLRIVYDGECPFCRSYVSLYRVRKLVGRVLLIDARTPHPLVDEIRRQQLDLDQGMVVEFNDRLFHGADAMQLLAILGSDGSWFNRLNRYLFRRPRLARTLYPLMVRGRLLTLRLLRRGLIAETGSTQPSA